MSPSSWIVSTLMSSLLVLGLAEIGGTGFAQGRQEAAPPPLRLRLRPLLDEAGAAIPYRFVIEAAPGSLERPEIVADRRLIEFVVQGPERRHRRVRCRHPEAPRRVDEARVRRLEGAEGAGWQEWIDLRMYCWGRASNALREGALVEATLGFRRRGRGRWIARSAGDPASAISSVAFEPLRLEAASVQAPSPAREPSDADPAISVHMRMSDARRPEALSFQVWAQATRRPVRIYPRFDLWSFRVEGPDGIRRCAGPRMRINPIVDFFVRLRGNRRGAATSLEASRICSGVFRRPGVYTIVPLLELPYGGERFGLDDVITGSFEGTPTVIRMRQGEERGYLEQVPAQLALPAPRGAEESTR